MEAKANSMNIIAKANETLDMARELADIIRANFDNPSLTKDDTPNPPNHVMALDRLDDSLTDTQLQLKYAMLTLRAKVLERLG